MASLTQSTLPFASTSATSSNPASNTPTSPQILLVLAGVLGTGKSTLANAMADQLANWTRVNQDELGSRATCEVRTRDALKAGQNVIIDRQNFDKSQRKVWIDLGNTFPGVSVRCFVLGTSEEECQKRLSVRMHHPTVQNPQQALALLDKFIGAWQEPAIGEGFDRLIVLPDLPNTDGLTAPLLSSLLLTLEDSPPNLKKNKAVGTGRSVRTGMGR